MEGGYRRTQGRVETRGVSSPPVPTLLTITPMVSQVAPHKGAGG